MVERLPFCPIDGRMTSMAKQTPERANLLQGTLDMLILRTLLYGPAHRRNRLLQRTIIASVGLAYGSEAECVLTLPRDGVES